MKIKNYWMAFTFYKQASKMTSRLNHRPLVMSLLTSTTPRRPCANCVCSPGLLSRQNRAALLIAQRLKLRRSLVHALTRLLTRGSLLSACQEQPELNTSERLAALRAQMVKAGVDVYVVPSEDAHLSELVSPRDQRRAFVSGFLGLAGVAIITVEPGSMNDSPDGLSALSTDSRYYLQAATELDFNWKVLKNGWHEWTIQSAIQMGKDSGQPIRIGLNPRFVKYTEVQQLEKKLSETLQLLDNPPDVKVVAVESDLVDAIWTQFEALPESPLGNIVMHDYAGEESSSKFERLSNELIARYNSTSLVVSALDDVAWLLNLRGSDVPYTPVFFSHLIIDESGKKTLYVDKSRLSQVVCEHLASLNIEIRDYELFYTDLETLEVNVAQNATWEVVRRAKKATLIVSPIERMKSIKNSTEIEGAVSAHVRDGIANVRFLAWLQEHVGDKEEFITEYALAKRQEDFRTKQDRYVGLSFETISASGKNGAIVHYAPPEQGSSLVDPSKIYLNDLGAQYLDGTTDVTRTVHLKTPSADERRKYTLVLKGLLALEKLKFPKDTRGYQIDGFARQFLWQKGLNYGHGTSHGIGSYLNVHEGPIGVSPNSAYASAPLKAGQVILIEPGFYEEGEFGIRIENVVVIEEQHGFLSFKNLTRVPYCRNLIDITMLNNEEVDMINAYHKSVLKDLENIKVVDEKAWKWLKKECAKL